MLAGNSKDRLLHVVFENEGLTSSFTPPSRPVPTGPPQYHRFLQPCDNKAVYFYLFTPIAQRGERGGGGYESEVNMIWFVERNLLLRFPTELSTNKTVVYSLTNRIVNK